MNAERPTGGYGREGRYEEEDSRPREGGRTWQEQPGYGERVLDPDEGQAAAEEEADHAETVEQEGQPPRGGQVKER